jgi:hypothetical protein
MFLLLTQMVFFGEMQVFIQLSKISLYETNEYFPCLKTVIPRKYSFQKQTQFTQLHNGLDAACFKKMVLCGEIHVFREFRWIGLFGSKTAYLHLETPKLKEVFHLKLTEFSQGNNVLASLASNMNGFL